MVKIWTARAAPFLGVALALFVLASVVLTVDLTPRVEGDFFFAEDDPQMQASRRVARQFPSSDQVILRVASDGADTGVAPTGAALADTGAALADTGAALADTGVALADTAYVRRVSELTGALLAVPGVESAFSVATDDPTTPLFRRILVNPDPAATNVVLQVDETPPEILLPRLEAVVADFEGLTHDSPKLDIVISGVPVIVELIRRSLFRDLVVFSAAAVAAFALLMTAIYRDAAVVVGTLATCFISVGVTLLMVQALDIGIGLLTANLVTIVFVLTLSHVVFLTGNWRQPDAFAAPEDGGMEPVVATVKATLEGSFWSMATTLLGFASLLVASARPLRELGIAGVVGASTALGVAYLVYPAFLAGWARRGAAGSGVQGGAGGAGGEGGTGGAVSAGVDGGAGDEGSVRVAPSTGPGRWMLPSAALVVLAAGVGVFRIDTDPGLLTYFQEGSELREGLSLIDADGGSSTLDIVVGDPEGARIDDREVFPRLDDLQATLEADPAVGVVLSPAVLIEHARTIPLAGFLPVPTLLNLASGESMGGVALAYAPLDRTVARFSLRMRERSEEPRQLVMDRLRGHVDDAGLEANVVAGLYDLQAQLGRLIASSLRVGIGGLLLLFLAIAWVVSRSIRVTLAMWLCLGAIPAVTLGLFGHVGVALDLITSPSANIALAIGADAMIHLVVRQRRLRGGGDEAPWAGAVAQIGPPVLGATTIVCAGFGIFALSSFPPTQRFGMAVIVGTLTAAVMALAILPRLALLTEASEA